MNARASGSPPGPAPQAAGVVGGRFAVQQTLGAGDFGTVYAAVDDRSQKRVALRFVPASLVPDREDAERIRAEVKAAAGLVHRNVVGTYGMGLEPSGDIFLTMELVEGQTLRTLLERRAAAGRHFSLRGAFNIVAHICHGLEHAAGKGVVHGSLSPHHVLITRAGRVKVAGFPLSRILPALRGLSPALRTYMLAYLAPEVRERGRRLDARTDVFSCAVILFELLGGKPRPGIVPSTASLPDAVPAGIRRVLDAALSHDPNQRPPGPERLESLLAQELERLGEIQPADDDLRVDIDIPVDLGSIAPPPPPRAASPAPPPPSSRTPPPARGSDAGALLRAAAATARSSSAPPAKGERVPVDQEIRRAEPAQVSLLPSIRGRASQVDFSAVLSQLDADDVERWMLQKDKLDHGPFRDRELAEMILRGDALADHHVTNLQTGVRNKLKHIDAFKPFLEKYRIRKKQEAEQAALQRSVRVERVGLAAKVAIAAGISVAVVGIALGLYYGLRASSGGSASIREDQKVASGGPTEVKGVQGISEATVEKLPPPDEKAKKTKRTTGRRRPGSSSSGSGRSGGGLMDWDTARSQGSNLGDLESDGSAAILTAREITAAMRSKFSAFRSCVGQNPGTTGRIEIEMLIEGHKVVAALVQGGTPGFEGCVERVLSTVTFQSQAYGQMRSTFSMEVPR
jgi:serine/threonine-protein kinase